jgi:bifunctional DNA-binding transcriptional regulator/antitoxin component of YhaV-PrlF toxin-antitoxin module
VEGEEVLTAVMRAGGRCRQQRGSLTLPASFRERYKIKPSDTFKIMDLDGIFVLMPMTPMVPELAREIERAGVEAGLSIEEMLTSLRQQRERSVREKYGQPLDHLPRMPYRRCSCVILGGHEPTEHGVGHQAPTVAEA